MSEPSSDLPQFIQWCRAAAAHLRGHPHIGADDLTAIQASLYYDGLRLLPIDLAQALPPCGPLTAGFARLDHLSAIATGRPPRRYFDVLSALERVFQWYDAATTVDSVAPRLTVDLARQSITLDGVVHEVPSVQALRWVSVLMSSPGQWFSSSDLEAVDPELIAPRTSRLLGYLPGPVRELIDTAPG